MKKLLLVILLIAAIAGAACRRTSSPSATATPSPAASPVEQLNHLAGGATPPPQTKYFKGSIGSSLDLQMKLVRDGDNLTGSYFYQKVGTRITLRGTVDKNGNLTLEEFDPSGKQTGVFKGLWSVDSQDNLIRLVGNWSKPPGEKGDDKKTAFSVHEEPINLSGGVEVIAKQIKDSNKKLNYEIDAQYPQFTGGAANPNFEKFNQTVRAAVTKEVAEFKKSMAPEEGEEPEPEDERRDHHDDAEPDDEHDRLECPLPSDRCVACLDELADPRVALLVALPSRRGAVAHRCSFESR